MKRLLITSALFVSTFFATSAQYDNSRSDNYREEDNYNNTRRYGNAEIKIRLSDNTPIVVMLDRKVFERPDRLMRFSNVPPKRYRIKVFTNAPSGRNRKNLVYDGYLKVEPSASYYLIVDRATGSLDIKSHMLEQNYSVTRDQNSNDNYYDFNDNADVNITNRDTRDGGDKDRFDNSNDRDYLSSETMTSGDMSALRTRVDAKSFSSDKLKLLKNALGRETYTADQVKTMTSWLNYDSDRLDFVKWAYNNTIDTRNYWRIESVFSFSATKDDFNEFLENQQK